MTRIALAATLTAVIAVSSPAYAFLGSTPDMTAQADYDPATGQMTVSVNNVINWYIESASMSLTGDAPLNLPAGGGLITDVDERIGETTGPFLSMTYTNIDLGFVAATGLPEGDLTIFWNPELSVPIESQPVVYGPILPIPEPTTITLATLSLLAAAYRPRSWRRH